MRLLSKSALVGKLISSKKFRDAFVYEHITTGIPFQVRILREERDWTQGKLAEIAGKPRNVITRLEDPNYGKLTLRTLIEMASAMNVGLLVKFVPFSRLVREYEDVSPVALSAPSISTETKELMAWASAKDKADVQIEVDSIPMKSLVTIADHQANKMRLIYSASQGTPLQGTLGFRQFHVVTELTNDLGVNVGEVAHAANFQAEATQSA